MCTREYYIFTLTNSVSMKKKKHIKLSLHCRVFLFLFFSPSFTNPKFCFWKLDMSCLVYVMIYSIPEKCNGHEISEHSLFLPLSITIPSVLSTRTSRQIATIVDHPHFHFHFDLHFLCFILFTFHIIQLGFRFIPIEICS